MITGPVHGPAAARRLLRRLLTAQATAGPAPRYLVEYPAPAVDALVNAGLDRIGGWEAKAMRDRAGVAGAHLLHDALRRELDSPQWLRALDRGWPAPGLLVSTRPMAGPDRGAGYARQCLLPGTAVALAPGALRSFTDDDSAVLRPSVDLVEARRVVRVLDWFGIRLDALHAPAAPAASSRCSCSSR
ncbi:hypothetical protein [Streptomyces sp. enrichment culture]|uniref:hypothetical protein n=1 Tax=Streptomyces sp. enrichment culture TaxID=1795815 RepID=UPI003F5720EA